MKILLIVPTYRYRDASPVLLSLSDFPTGLAYIAASLKEAGHEVFGLNLNNDMRYPSKILMLTNRISQALEDVKPDLIGIGGICVDYPFIKDAMEVIRLVSQIPIVLGGGIVNNDREFVFKTLKPDYAIVGEGEEEMVKLANNLEKEFTDGWMWKSNNLSFWIDCGGCPIHTKVNYEYRPIDERPIPDYEVFGIQEMMDKYSDTTRVLYRFTRVHPRPMVIVTARGCPFNCTFCVHRGGPKYRARSIENIMEEIRVNYERYHFNILLVVDELFAVNKERMRQFCNALLEGKEKYGWDFDWMFQTHANARLDKDTLALAKEAGCYFFSYGLESASPKVLKSMNKKTQIPQLIEALKLAEECKVGFGGNLIFGDPAEDEATIQETLQFYAHYCEQAFVFLGILMPYPGSDLFDYCIQKGIIKDKKEFYETIDQKLYNMTSLPPNVYMQWINFINMLERSWLWVKTTDATQIKEIECANPSLGKMYQIDAICPVCGEEVSYGQMLKEMTRFMGVGCTKCCQRIRINLPEEVMCQSTGATAKDAVLTSRR